MRELVEARDWFTVVRLPAHAPEMNPTEGIWSRLKAQLANLVITTLDDLVRLIHTKMRAIQRDPDLAADFLAQSDMTLEPEIPWPP